MITTFILLFTWVNAFSVKQPTIVTTSVKFTVVNAGFEVEGTLQITRVEIDFDPRKLSQSSVSVVVDPSSIKTGIGVRDKHLKRSDYFDVARYREIQLKSTGFKKTGRSAFVGTFDLTIKDITRAVEIPFTVKNDQSGTLYEARFKINRLDFKLGEDSVILEDDVEVVALIRY